MKSVFLTTLAAACTLTSAFAQRFQQEAMLIFDENRFETVWIADATKSKFLYFETVRGVDTSSMLISEPASIWLMEPAAYTQAMELFQARNYTEARELFAQVRKEYIKLRTLPDNHSALAALHEMECLRHLGKLDELAKAMEAFLPDDRNSLTREHHLVQLDLYGMWDAARAKDWTRLEMICREKLESRLPGYQRVQAGYCLGLALEGQQKALPAINAYNIAMTADTGASEYLTRMAAENSLRLYAADPLVKQAIRFWGTPEEEANSIGSLRLAEAASLASLHKLTLGAGNDLPDEAKDLLKYAPEGSGGGE